MKRFIALLILLAVPALSESRRDIRGNYTRDEISRYMEATLELDRIVYRSQEKIPLRFRITNTGYRIFRIYPNENTSQSFQFLVETRAGRELAPLDKTLDKPETPIRDLTGNGVKEILLHPGETFEKKIVLSDLYRFQPGEEYRISGYFVPGQDSDRAIRTRGTVRLRIGVQTPSPLAEDEPGESGTRLQVSPEETVYLFLSAELKRNWENYLKYLDLPHYIASYDRFALRYAAASDMERPEIANEFRRYLTGRSSDTLKRFKIISVNYDRDSSGMPGDRANAKVVVHADRETEGFKIRYEYVYTLSVAEQEGFWKIVYVAARVIRQGSGEP